MNRCRPKVHGQSRVGINSAEDTRGGRTDCNNKKGARRETDRQRKRDRENTLLHKDKKLSKSVSAVFTNLSLDDKYSNTAERERESPGHWLTTQTGGDKTDTRTGLTERGERDT